MLKKVFSTLLTRPYLYIGAVFVIAFFVFVVNFNIVLAADDNSQEPGCAGGGGPEVSYGFTFIDNFFAHPALAAEEDTCDNSSSMCEIDYGLNWTSNGYPGGNGNPNCCGDDSQENHIDTDCNGNSISFCCPDALPYVSGGACVASCPTCGDNNYDGSEYDFDQSTCQSEFSADAWDRDYGDSSSGCWDDMCCGDDDYEYYADYFGDSSISACCDENNDSDVVAYKKCDESSGDNTDACSSDLNDRECCFYPVATRWAFAYPCVYDGSCYAEDDITTDTETGSEIVCINEWFDCDYSSTMCSNCGHDWLSGGEGSAFGEYDSGSATECCEDDPNENEVTNYCSGYSGGPKCCADGNNWIDASGNCVASCPLTCGDNSYDGSEYDYGQSSCESEFGTDAWDMNYGNSTSVCWDDMCCGDDTDEDYQYRIAAGGCSGSACLSFVTDSSDNACCIDDSYCVKDFTCYSTGNEHNLSGENAYCSNTAWFDCDYNSGVCETAGMCSYTWVASQEAGVGEYDYDGANGCCEDDDNEELITCYKDSNIYWSCYSPAFQACCDNASDCATPQDGGQCVSDGGVGHGDSSEDDHWFYCDNGTWVDCDDDISGCGGGVVCGSSGGLYAGEIIGEYSDTYTLECCGDDFDETREDFRVHTDSEPIAWTGSSLCCEDIGISPGKCTSANVCHDWIGLASNLNGGGHDDIAFCNGGQWVDCDSVSPTGTTACDVMCSLDLAIAGESGVGEYTDTVSALCCGDDNNENLIGSSRYCSGYAGPDKCCDNASDYIETDGTCVSSCNNPPHVPSNSDPADGAICLDMDVTLTWTGGDPDAGDSVTYYVYFCSGSESCTLQYIGNTTLESYYVGDITQAAAIHRWQIIAIDNHSAQTNGPLWDFTTHPGMPSENTTDGVNPVCNTSDTVAVSWSNVTSPTGEYAYSSDAVCNASDSYSSGNSVTVNSSYTNYICFRNSNECETGYSSAHGPLMVDTDVPVVSNAQARPDSYVDTGETDDDTEIYFTWDQVDVGACGAVSNCSAEIGDATPDEDAGTDGQDTDTGVEGLNTYYVRCWDGAGNVSNTDSDTITISLNSAPNEPTNLSQSPGAEGNWTNDDTPYFDFTISDPNAGDTVGYQIQVDDNSSFSSPAIDFTWGDDTINPNDVSYQIPDISDLSDGCYYWQVRGRDQEPSYSSWVEFGNSGTIDFCVDTQAPNAPSCAPPPGTYASAQSVSFSNNGDPAPSSGGLVIHYTDNGSNATCSSAIYSSPILTSSPTTYRVVVCDGAGNMSNQTVCAYDIGNLPDTSITTDPPDPDNDSTPTFDFEGTNSPTGFECWDDEGTYDWDSCTSPLTYTVSAGNRQFQVRAINAYGTDPTPASHAWCVDLTDPTVSGLTADTPICPGDTTTVDWDGNDTGCAGINRQELWRDINGGGWTGRCNDGSWRSDCSSYGGYTDYSATESASVALTTGGTTQFGIHIFDNANNYLYSPATDVVVDATPPASAPTCTPGTSNFVGSVDVTCSATEGTVRYTLSTGGTPADPTCASAVWFDQTFVDTTTIKVIACDVCDNSTSINTYVYTEGFLPDTSITTDPPDPDNDSTPTFEFEGTNSPTSFECRYDGAGGWSVCTSPRTYSVSEGSHTFEVRAINAFGTDPTPASHTWLVDLTAPEVESFAPSLSTICSGDSSTLTWTSTEYGSPASGTNRVEVWYNEGSGWAQVSAGDCAGNHSEDDSCSASPTVDTQYGIHVVDDADNCIDEGGSHCGGVSSDSRDSRPVYGPDTITVIGTPVTPGNPSYSGTTQTATDVSWTGASGATSYDLYRCAGAGCPRPGSANFTDVSSPYTDATLACGTVYRYWVGANNVCGTTFSSDGTAVTTDACDSAGPILDAVPASAVCSDTTTDITLSVSDTSGVAESCYRWDNATVASCPVGTTDFNDNDIITSPAFDGSHTLYLWAEDSLGNPSSSSFEPYRYDDTDPTINVFNVEDDAGIHISDFNTLDTSLIINWDIEDSGSCELSVIEIWRQTDGGGWVEIYDNNISGDSNSGNWTNDVTCGHEYEYGIHVIDGAGNCILESGEDCTGGTGAPIKATVGCTYNLTNVQAASCYVFSMDWEDAVPAPASGYFVYRSDGSGAGCDFVFSPESCTWLDVTNDIDIAGSYAEDSSISFIEGQDYAYFISTNPGLLNNSTLSPSCTGEIGGVAANMCPLSDTTPLCPVPIGDVTITRHCGYLDISWPDDNTNYKLMRCIDQSSAACLDADFDNPIIYEGADASYTDDEVIPVSVLNPPDDNYYCYAVVGYNADGDPSATSTPACDYSYCYRGPSWQER